MHKPQPAACQSPRLPSNVQAFPKYRANLGIGISPSVKKGPQVTYRPNVGTVQVNCCLPKT